MTVTIDPIAGAAGLVNAGSSVANTVAAFSNLALQKKQFKYQQDLQQIMFQREDTAAQRRAADLRAAGLSPTLAAGSAASVGPVVPTQAPQMGQIPDFSQAISVALGLMQQKAQIAVSESQYELNQMQKEKVSTDVDKLKSDIVKNKADTYHSYVKARRDIADAETKEHDLDFYVRNDAPTNGTPLQKHLGSVADGLRNMFGGPAREVDRQGKKYYVPLDAERDKRKARLGLQRGGSGDW